MMAGGRGPENSLGWEFFGKLSGINLQAMMKAQPIAVLLLFIVLGLSVYAQPPERLNDVFSSTLTIHSDLPYAGDTLKKHTLDIYVPPGGSARHPLVVWIHGGAWMMNDKYADMGYMKGTIKRILDAGYALASINYRYSTDAVFPAQIQDCNQALEWLYQHAEQYSIDKSRIALIGFSAGGHLASLLGLSNNNRVAAFSPPGLVPHFKIKCVLDFYGPSDLMMLASSTDSTVNNGRNSVSLLLGAWTIDRPDLARRASPVTYIDKDDPPFLIVQGEKDESVPNTQSKILHSWLTLAGIPNDLIVVPNAPHYGEMFDAEYIREKLMSTLSANMK